MSASSEFTLGLNNERSSSRVLKPPGGGHSNIFAAPESELPRARPKYDQQNSSNLNFCMNTTDPNEAVAKIVHDLSPTAPAPVINKPAPVIAPTNNNSNHNGGIIFNGGATTNGTAHHNGGSVAATFAPPVQKPPTPAVVEKQPIVEKASAPTPIAASAPAPAATAPSSPPGGFSRVRQPPGGFSSGLW